MAGYPQIRFSSCSVPRSKTLEPGIEMGRSGTGACIIRLVEGWFHPNAHLDFGFLSYYLSTVDLGTLRPDGRKLHAPTHARTHAQGWLNPHPDAASESVDNPCLELVNPLFGFSQVLLSSLL